MDVSAVRARVRERLTRAEALVDVLARVTAAEDEHHLAEAAAAAGRERLVDAARSLAARLVVDKLDPPLRQNVVLLRESPLGLTVDALAAAHALLGRAGALRDLAQSRAAKVQRQLARAEAATAAYDQVVARRDELHEARRLRERLAE